MTNVNLIPTGTSSVDNAEQIAALFSCYADYEESIHNLPLYLANMGIEDTIELRRAII